MESAVNRGGCCRSVERRGDGGDRSIWGWDHGLRRWGVLRGGGIFDRFSNVLDGRATEVQDIGLMIDASGGGKMQKDRRLAAR